MTTKTSASRRYVAVTEGTAERLVAAARDMSPVCGLTHNFYRYPARFSPILVRAAVEAFTDPGDLVLDPFMGGGTTLVEALALGRQALGTDISSLATFVSEVKTILFSERELAKLSAWSGDAVDGINMHGKARPSHDYSETGYYRHMDNAATWRFRKAIEQGLSAAMGLESPRLEAFARCAILRTAQWALDGRKKLPSIAEFRDMLASHTHEMLNGVRLLRQSVKASGGVPQPIYCLNRSTAGLESDSRLKDLPTPRLVCTSPPYPGVHVLYHRWQVDGRKETPAPFWIANKLDGDGSSYYTMGDRKAFELNTYFDKLRANMQSIAAVCGKDTTVMQVVAFSDPSWQLPRYLSVVDDVGLKEQFLPTLKGERDGRLWRSVPNRKWYAGPRGITHGSQEVVLFHSKR
ncbi:MAG: DNA methyltransferase [Acidiferrobacterales bacterium]